jgi:hypothetical protein
MNKNSTLLVHDAFDNWTMLYLQPNHQAYLFDFNLQTTANHAAKDGFETAYFI